MLNLSTTSREAFHAVFKWAHDESADVRRNCSAPEAILDLDPEDTYVLSDDLYSGFVVRANGELVYLFSVAPEGGRGDDLVRTAGEIHGASHLDCFDGPLVRLYSRNGWVENRREANWTEGEPDVVYMVSPEWA